MDDMLDLIVTPKKYEEIEFNFDQLKEEISVQLKRYTNMVVTEETIKLAKEDKAELNKLMKALDTRRKEVKKECMEPYEAFASKVKELTDLIADSMAESCISTSEQSRPSSTMRLVDSMWPIMRLILLRTDFVCSAEWT